MNGRLILYLTPLAAASCAGGVAPPPEFNLPPPAPVLIQTWAFASPPPETWQPMSCPEPELGWANEDLLRAYVVCREGKEASDAQVSLWEYWAEGERIAHGELNGGSDAGS